MHTADGFSVAQCCLAPAFALTSCVSRACCDFISRAWALRVDDMTLSTENLIALLDVTRLVDHDDPQQFALWLQQAAHKDCPPAAYCVYPQYLQQAAAYLHTEGIQAEMATVVNFPTGDEPLSDVLQQIEFALKAGATEIDAVLPYRRLLAGDETTVREFMQAVRQACGDCCLKIIIESGELAEPALIALATEIAISGGADFVKTSTGKVAVGVTLEAARVMLGQIQHANRPVGFKASGGVRDKSFALQLSGLFADILQQVPTAASMRIGASALYLDLIRELTADATSSAGSTPR